MAIRQLNPLSWTVPIVDASGRPTEEFMRKWAQQTQINSAIFDTSTLPAHAVVLGTGKQASLGFSPLGTGGQILVGQTGADPAFKSVSQDGALTAAGALTVTGLQTRAVSATNPTNGQVLEWNGSAWAPATLPVATQYASVVFDGSDVYFANAVSLADPELVFAGGVPTYTKNPTIPYSILSGTPSIPVGANPSATAKDTAVNGSAATFMRSDAAPAVQKASSSQFGIVEVDNTTITAASGVISAVAQTLPTRQVLLSGTAATYTTPVGCRQLRIRMVGGGGGGGGSGTQPAGGSDGTSATQSSFNSIGAAGGGKGFGNGNPGAAGTGGAGTASFRSAGNSGGPGGFDNTATTLVLGGYGGASLLGGGGGSATAAVANSGGGGGGGNTAVVPNVSGGGGGGGGEYVELIINSPAATYTYTIGANGTGGAAGTSGGVGQPGGTGVIIVDEYY